MHHQSRSKTELPNGPLLRSPFSTGHHDHIVTYHENTHASYTQHALPYHGSEPLTQMPQHGIISKGEVEVQSFRVQGFHDVAPSRESLQVDPGIDLENGYFGITKAGRPRKRLAQACVACRERKTKCEPNNLSKTCRACQKSGRGCRFDVSCVGQLHFASTETTH